MYGVSFTVMKMYGDAFLSLVLFWCFWGYIFFGIYGIPTLVCRGFFVIGGGIWMLDYILKSLISYSFVPVFLQVFILIFVVIADPYIMKKQKRIMMIITILVICLIFDNLLSDYLSTSRSTTYLRTIESIFGYSIRPVIIVLFFYIVNQVSHL